MEFVRAISPGTSFYTEKWRLDNYLMLHPIVEGTPHYESVWLRIEDATGVVTNGTFPGDPPKIAWRPKEDVSKDMAIARGVLQGLVQHSDIDQFVVKKAMAFWVVPRIEPWASASTRVKAAAKERQAIRAYLVEFIGERAGDEARRMLGRFWVDAETGSPLSGSIEIADDSASEQSPVPGLRNPTAIFVKNGWQRIVTKALSQRSANPKGELVLAMEKDVVNKGRYDGKSKILWLPDKEAWRATLVSK